MSRFRKLSHTLWHCQYHIVWVPKYRYRVLTGAIKESCQSSIHAICGFSKCEVVELNVQADHVSSGCDDTSQACRIHIDVEVKGPNCHACIPAVPSSAEAALLGKSFLGQGVLCGYHRPGC